MLMGMWTNRDTHALVVGMQNDTASLEDSYKIKHTLTIQSSSHARWYLVNLCLLTLECRLLVISNSAFISNCENLEATKMSLSR